MRDEQGRTALHLAASFRAREAGAVLLQEQNRVRRADHGFKAERKLSTFGISSSDASVIGTSTSNHHQPGSINAGGRSSR